MTEAVNINLDEKRQKRQTGLKPPTVTNGGKTFELVAELPYSALRSLKKIMKMGDDAPVDEMMDELDSLFSTILGDNFEEFIATNPNMGDLKALSEEIGELYKEEEASTNGPT
jgi:hypothetical protein